MFIYWYDVTGTKADITWSSQKALFFISPTSPRNVAALILHLVVLEGKRLTESLKNFIKICIINTRVPTAFTRNVIVCVYNYKHRDEIKC